MGLPSGLVRRIARGRDAVIIVRVGEWLNRG
jgi:hypothetical protein